MTLLTLLACKASFVVPDAPLVDAADAAPALPEMIANDPRALVPTPLTVEEAGVASRSYGDDPRIAILPIESVGAELAAAGGILGGLVGSQLGGMAEGLGIEEDLDQALSALGAGAAGMLPSGTGSAGALLEHELPMVLLSHGYERFVGPDQLRFIAAEKVRKTDGEVTWTASLARLVEVEPVGDFDLLLGVDVLDARATEVDVDVGFHYDPAAMASYGAAYAAWAPGAEAELSSLNSERAAYKSSCLEARDAYEGKRGKYNGDPPTSGDIGLEQCNRTLGSLDSRIGVLSDQLALTLPPKELEEGAKTRTAELKVPAYELSVRVRVIDAQELRTLWMADIATRDVSGDEAVGRVLGRVVEELDAH